MKNQENKSVPFVRRILTCTTSLLLVLAIVAFTVSCSFIGTKPIDLTKDEILENIKSKTEENTEHSYAASYLLDYGITGFDSVKFKQAESLFDRNSIYELESKEELAIKTAELFVEFYYDITDLSDKDAVTDALITCFVEATGDKYAVYRTKAQYDDYKTDMSGSFVGIGVYVRYSATDNTVQVTSVMEDSGALEAGILAGDFLYAVDGKTLEELSYNTFVNSIKGEVGSTVTVTVIRGGEYIDFTITRKQITEKTVSYSINDDKIGYVRISGFKENTKEQFIAAINALEAAGTVGIIFDMRDNPGGYLTIVVDVIDYLVPKGTRIASDVSVSKETVYTATSDHRITVPITVIFNGGTASAGELFSAAMRDYNDMGILKCTTVGTNTYSKGVMQNTGKFYDGSTLTLTIAYYNPPCDVNYDGVGVAPDVPVNLGSGGDNQLDAAYVELSKLIN